MELCQAATNRCGMGRQSFGIGERDGRWADRLQCRLVEADHADNLGEVVDIDRAGKAGGAAGRHHVAGPGHVVTQHFKAALAQEDAAGVADLAQPLPGVGNQQAEMFGRIGVGQPHRLRHAVGHDDAAAARQRPAQ